MKFSCKISEGWVVGCVDLAWTDHKKYVTTELQSNTQQKSYTMQVDIIQ
jgi:hypothetical protein